MFITNQGFTKISMITICIGAVLNIILDPVFIYAFGMGVERITNLKYQVKDLRMFSENDVRFLDEFMAAN